jgi:xanthine dehydrogenase large subunit
MTGDTTRPASPLHQPALHESGYRHATGEALYVDDLPEPGGMLVALLVPSPHAHARIVRRDASGAREVAGVAGVFFADDVPGNNLVGAIFQDEALLAEEEVHCCGQAVALVVGESYQACREAAALVEVEYEELPAILGIEQAIAEDSYLFDPHVIARGDVEAALVAAPVRVDGERESGGQDHLYLETQAALALPLEDGNIHVYASTQHPTEVQHGVSGVLGLGSHKVVCEVLRMGGAFGGKESQATQFACLAALGAWHTGRPVKVRLDRDADMIITGKRHPAWSRYRAGFDGEGRLLALDVHLYFDAGWTADLSGPILDRGLYHLDNTYFIPDLRFEGRACRTNVPSNTAMRGFGGPQGMIVVEDALNRVAERLGLDPAEVRRRNYYGGPPRNLAPYGQEVTEVRIHRIHEELLRSSDYAERRDAIDAFNENSTWVKRGIGYQPVKFGISFTKSVLNQAGALVLVYADGTVQLNHGGTEMGQGLHTKMLAVCAHELGVPMGRIRVMNTATDKVPNTSATAASSGSDINGQAVREACTIVRERMRPIAADLLEVGEAEAGRIRFEDGHCRLTQHGSVSFEQVAQACWLNQISLSSTGFYRTPNIWYDHAKGRGKPFHYYAYGGAVTEVELNGLTGEHCIRRVDILHDVGDPLVPSVDRGQVEGGFVQGAGWLTSEEMLIDEAGKLLTVGPSTYKIPAYGDCPPDFRVRLLDRARQSNTIHGSKAVGEPPFMLAISAITALRHAIASFGQPGMEVELALPATAEALLRAVEDARARAARPTDRPTEPAPVS